HQLIPQPVTSTFFYWHRADLDYTRPWTEDVGLPFEVFGPSYRKTPPRRDSCERCKQPFEGRQLVVKEKLRRPTHPGTPDRPQYLIVHYSGPPEIELGNGKTKMNKAAWRNQRVRPIMEQRFGAYRENPTTRPTPSRVFETAQQAVFRLVGLSVVKSSIDHVAWRQHSPSQDHFIHFEADQYFGIDEYDYLLNGQRVTFAIYKSTGEKSDGQPREHEADWQKAGHKRHGELARKGEAFVRTKRVTRGAAAATQDDEQQPGPSGTQQRQQPEAPRKDARKKTTGKKR
ncbi:hypothetical protein AAVH_31165, partial [Aphelenchoides avenae]